MSEHRHYRYWLNKPENKVYSHSMCGVDSLVQEVTDPNSFFFEQQLTAAALSSMTAFQTELASENATLNDIVSAKPSSCDECEALFGFKVLGELP